MRRRDFIVGLGGTAALSLACWSPRASAQQRTPVVGMLSFGTPESTRQAVHSPAFTQALKEGGFVEGQNVAFEFRYASGQFNRLPTLAADLVGQRVDLIYTPGLPPAIAAKAATATIPIVFNMGEDPVKEGIVASLNRPGGNATGFTGFGNQLIAKRLELLHQAVPKAAVIGFLVNPNNPNGDPDTKDARTAALAHGLSLRVLDAASERDFERVFATITQERIGALLVGVEPFFWDRRQELVALATRNSVPVVYDLNIFPAVGGLMTYGTSPSEGDRQVGLYLGRILKGTRPADLPVVQATKFEFVINLKTAKSLGLTIPETLLATADEVIQ
jgi:putative tryptophan/tyrosine transport system substrate-binding protein